MLLPVLNGNVVSDNGQAPGSPSSTGMEGRAPDQHCFCPEIGDPSRPAFQPRMRIGPVRLPHLISSFLEVIPTCLSRLLGNCLRPHSSNAQVPQTSRNSPGPLPQCSPRPVWNRPGIFVRHAFALRFLRVLGLNAGRP